MTSVDATLSTSFTPPTYHCSDFDYAEHVASVVAAAAAAASDDAVDAFDAVDADDGGVDSAAADAGTAPDGATAAVAASAAATAAAVDAWETFHAVAHRSGRFFQPKRVVIAEFPELLRVRGAVLDVGCGNGSTAVAIATANRACTVHACDVSASAVTLCAAAASSAGVADRVHCFVLDASRGDAVVPGDVAGRCAAVTCVFVLGAVPPARLDATIKVLGSALAPGGKLFLRDYREWDHAMQRFIQRGAERWPVPAADAGTESHAALRHAFVRGDGTLQTFFPAGWLSAALVKSGVFTVDTEETHTVRTVNHRSGAVLYRCFAHVVATRVD